MERHGKYSCYFFLLPLFHFPHERLAKAPLRRIYFSEMDKLSPEKRSWTMAQVKGRDTKPERIVRSLCTVWDTVLEFNEKTYPAILYCSPEVPHSYFCAWVFWHRHLGCKHASMPAVNVEYWKRKFERNVERDMQSQEALLRNGWHVLVIWECELKNLAALQVRLLDFFNSFCTGDE